ncbi:hypothetical protein DM02DRAFT_683587 [Periconia macrospinosa]|uniref:Uncharacterized protein n=1 Tax=Periconia macrospinosa TaxID=97972 RepID=A0A2V1DK22_9PLEO|nr:hypothetical protein DM02DRAFT_683587 [Periconia macrospinosa]
MNNRHSSPQSPLPMTDTLRPPTQRKRSNSVPIMEALGCSTPEARLILAEGKAAVSSRRQSTRRRRRIRDQNDPSKYNPRHHLQYLETNTQHASDKDSRQDSMYSEDQRVPRHSRYPSNATDSSVSTVTAGHDQSTELDSSSHIPTKSPVGDYSANLARFIRAQLSSIPTYSPTQLPLSPSSCPDFSYTSGASPRSPPRSMLRTTEPPKVIAIPPIRPPMQSAFSEWSSMDDDDTDDEIPALPTSDPDTNAPATKAAYTPSLLRYYENSQDSSFLLSETPAEDEPNTAKGLSFPASASFRPARSPAPVASSPPPLMPGLAITTGPPSSTTSSADPSLVASSAPSISTVSTNSYFEFKLNPTIRDRVIAAKILTATSPFEGKPLANVHDVLIESHHRVHVDGMSFDMINEYTVMAGAAGSRGANSMHRVQTPC